MKLFTSPQSRGMPANAPSAGSTNIKILVERLLDGRLGISLSVCDARRQILEARLSVSDRRRKRPARCLRDFALRQGRADKEGARECCSRDAGRHAVSVELHVRLRPSPGRSSSASTPCELSRTSRRIDGLLFAFMAK